MKASIGKIYILRNSAFKDRLVKIGLTTRLSEERAIELSKPTGVPNEFEVLYEEDVIDCKLAEKLIHDKLIKYRHNSRREFFDIPLKMAVKTVFETCQKVNTAYNSKYRARLAIAINHEILNKQNLEVIRDLLSEYPGDEVDVHLIILHVTSKTTLSLPPKNRIMLSAEMLNKLKQLKFISDIILTKGSA